MGSSTMKPENFGTKLTYVVVDRSRGMSVLERTYRVILTAGAKPALSELSCIFDLGAVAKESDARLERYRTHDPPLSAAALV